MQTRVSINGIRVVQDELEAAWCLKNGETICRFEYGDSMYPILKNGEYAILHPLADINEIKIGDAVFCEMEDVQGSYYMTHMVGDIKEDEKSKKKLFAIDTTNGFRFGWTENILAKAEGTNIIEPPLI